MSGNKKVIIVEDEMIIAQDIKLFVLSLGYDVINIFSKGESLLDKVIQEKPDLIIMDVFLNGQIDGIETAKRLKGLYEVPILFVTAHSDKGTMRNIERTGYYGYIIKPFKEYELKTAIEDALQH